MLRFLVVLIGGLCAAGPAFAQFTLASPDTSRVLTVSGFGRAAMDADRAILTVAFETEGETIDEAIDKHEQEVSRVRALLLGAGVPEAQIKLDRVSVGSASRGSEYGAMRSSGADERFSASRTLIVRMDDLDAIPRLLASIVRNEDDDLLDVQRRNVNVRYTVRDPESLQNEALRDAVDNARQRAALIAEMGDLRLGTVLTVVEAGAAPWGSEAMTRMMMMEGGSGLIDGEFVLNAQVVVTFRIQ